MPKMPRALMWRYSMSMPGKVSSMSACMEERRGEKRGGERRENRGNVTG